MSDQNIKIMAQPQMNPQKCDFIVEKPLIPYGAFRLHRSQDHKGSQLALSLFAIDAVEEFLVAGRTLTVTKTDEQPWTVVGKAVGAAMREAIASDQPLISSELSKKSDTEKQLGDSVKKIIEEKVNPAVASHGGFIELIDVQGQDVFIRMGGGCQGCASSTATLKQGVEQTLRESIPQLGQIIDTTDHAAGQNPYY